MYRAANIQTYIRKALTETYRLEAKQYLPKGWIILPSSLGLTITKYL